MQSTNSVNQMIEQTNRDLIKFQKLFSTSKYQLEDYRMYLLSDQTLKTKRKECSHYYFNFLQYMRLIDNWQLHFHLERIDSIHNSFLRLFIIIEKALRKKKSITGRLSNRNGGKFKIVA